MLTIALLVILAAGGLVWLGVISVRCLREAMLLGSLPKGIAAALEGQRVAIHGRVKILEPLVIPGLGPVLWCRRIDSELDSVALRVAFGTRRSNQTTTSDQSEMATFALEVGGEELAILDLPTETQETQSRRESDSDGILDQLFSQTFVRETQWLPVSEEATVIGRLERRDDRRGVVADPELGLLLSPLAPDRAARVELLKGVLGLIGVAAGMAVLIWLLTRYLPTS